MAITRYAGDRFTTNSSDTKPTGVLDGAYLIDTGNLTQWVRRTVGGSSQWNQLAGGGGGGGTPGGANTQVQFNNAGAFGGNANLTFDGSKLAVNDLALSGIIYDSNNSIGNGGMVLTNEGTTGVNWKSIESVLSGVGGSGVANYVARWSDEDTITSGVIQDDGTAVGINQAADPDNALAIKSIANNTNPLQIAAHDGDSLLVFRQTAGDGRLSIKKDGGVETIRLDSDNVSYITGGNFGIGTNAPYYKLDLRFDNSDTSFSGGGGGNWGGNGLRVENDNTTVGSMALVQFRTATADWFIGNKFIQSSPDQSDFIFSHEDSEKVRIKYDGNVGIGTTNPSQKLHLYGSNANLTLDRDNTDYGASLEFSQQGNNKWTLKGGQTSGVWDFAIRSATGTERLTILQDGNIGIGNSGPSFKLQVNGTVRINSGDSFLDDGQSVRWGGTAAKIDGSSGGDYLRFYTDAAERMRIVSGGSVGIGTTDPAELLEVYGTEASGSVELLLTNVGDGGSSTTPYTAIRSRLNTIRNGGEIRFGRDSNYGSASNADSNMQFYTALDDTNTERMRITSAGKVGIGTNAPAGQLHIIGSNVTDQVIIENTDATSTSAPDLILYRKSATPAAGDNIGLIQFRGRNDNSQDVNYASILANAVDETDTTEDTKLSFYTYVAGTETESVVIKSGSVGIGTATPGAKLHVNGYARIGNPHANEDQASTLILSNSTGGSATHDFLTLADTANNGSETGRIVFKARYGTGSFSAGQEATFISSIRAGTSGAYHLAFGTTNDNSADAVERVRISSLGNVGIGTTSPSTKLHVVGSGTDDGIKVHSGTNVYLELDSTDSSTTREVAAKYKNYSTGTNFWWTGLNQASRYDFAYGTTFINANIKVSILTDGNVGIGTNNPGSKLHVLGDTLKLERTNNAPALKLYNNHASPADDAALGYLQFTGKDNDGTANMVYSEVRGGVQANANTAVSGYLAFLTTNNATSVTEAMRIKADGSVGIATTNPAAKLDVSGNILRSGLTYSSWTSRSINTLTQAGATINYILIAPKTTVNVRLSGRFKCARSNGVSAVSIAHADVVFCTDNDANPQSGGIHSASSDIPSYGHANFEIVELEYSSTEYYALKISPSASWTAAFAQIEFEGISNNVTWTNIDSGNVSNVGAFGGSQAVFAYKHANVGIGTDSPSARLHITSDGSHDEGAEIVLRHANNNSTDVVSTLSFQNNAGQVAMIQGGTTSGNNNGYISFFTDNAGTSGERMRITSNGNVTIGNGTQIPYNKLHVYGSGRINSLMVGNAAPSNVPATALHIKSSGTDAVLRIEDSDSSNQVFDFLVDQGVGFQIIDKGTGSSTNTRLTINTNGNVGIGTTNPDTAKLYVRGGASSQTFLTGADELIVEGSDHAGISILAPAAKRAQLYFNSDAFLRWVDNDGVFSIDTSASASKIALGPSGADVGVGTNSPTTSLHIRKTGLVDDSRNALLLLDGKFAAAGVNSGDEVGIAFRVENSGGGSQQTTSITSSYQPSYNSLNLQPAGGKVGIGTVSPDAKLHVHLTGSAGSFSNIGLFRAGPDSNDSGAEIFVGQQGNSRGLVIRGGRGTGDQALAHFYLNQSGGTIPSTTQNHVMTFLQGGYVGIGTTDPGTNKLLVNGNSYLDGTAYVDDALTVDGYINFETMGDYLTFYGNANAHHSISSRSSAGSANDDIRINTYGALFINLDSNGNDSSESHSSFQIGRHAGTGAVSASDLLLNLSGETGKLRLYKYGSGSFTTGTPAYRLLVDSSGNVIEGNLGAGVVDGSGTTNYIARWSDTDTIGNSNIFDNGTIGIGTAANLNGKVTIREAGNSGGPNHIFCMLSASAVGHGASIFLKTSTNVSNNRYGARIRAIRNANNNAAADLAFSLENSGATGLAEMVRFTSDGNVGIGITAPSQKLHVNGTIKAGIAGNSSANTPALLVAAAGTAPQQSAIAIQQGTNEGDTIIFADYEPYVEWGINTDNGSDTIEFTAGTSTNNLGSKTLYNNAGSARTAYKKHIFSLSNGNFTAGGNVGIGDPSPSQPLTIKRSSAGQGEFGLRFEFENTSGPTATSSAILVGAYGLKFKNYNSGRNFLFETGNVGIGTATPRTNLHVYGTGVDNGLAKVRIGGNTNNTAMLELAETENNSGVMTYGFSIRADGGSGGDSTNDFQIRYHNDSTSGVTGFHMERADGNIGIGTTSNGYKLRVQGNVYISGTLTEASSLAIKENVETFEPSLDIINKIRPVKYDKKTTGKKEIGLIAEELAELFPELVEKDKNGNPSGVNYSRAVTVLLGGFKELYKEVQELKKRI